MCESEDLFEGKSIVDKQQLRCFLEHEFESKKYLQYIEDTEKGEEVRRHVRQRFLPEFPSY